jgi:hypothetical protein
LDVYTKFKKLKKIKKKKIWDQIGYYFELWLNFVYNKKNI